MPEHQHISLRASFSAKEIAARNGFSVSFVYQEIADGKLRATRPGGSGPLRITPEAEQEWLSGAAEKQREQEAAA